MTRKTALHAALLAATMFAGGAAHAQAAAGAADAGNVVIMRRYLQPPKRNIDEHGYDQNQFHYEVGPWTADDPQNACSADVAQSRPVGCVKNYKTAPDSSCPGEKPAEHQIAPNYASCTFSWEVTGYTA